MRMRRFNLIWRTLGRRRGTVHPFEGKGFVRASVGAAGCKRVEGFVSRGNDVENRVSGQTSYGTSTGSES